MKIIFSYARTRVLFALLILILVPLVTASGVGYSTESEPAGDQTVQSLAIPGPGIGSGSVIPDSMADVGILDDAGSITTYPVKPMAGGIIQFTVSGTYPSGTLFSWNFGDGISQNSNTATIGHQYQKTGIYPVSVTINSSTAVSMTLDLTLQKGDILVHAGEGIISAIIPGVWSHTGMYIGNDTILESTSVGVHISNISVWSYPGDTCVAAFRLPGISNQTRDTIVQWGVGKNRLPYDIWSILLYTKQLDCQSATAEPLCNRYYCSELVWAAYKGNGIDLDPIYGAVLPQTVVSGTQQTTELVGAHIEKIPAAFMHYQKYYDQIMQGKNPPYIKGTLGEDTSYELIILGTVQDTANLSELSTITGSRIQSEAPSPEMVELYLKDPLGRELSGMNNTIPNSSIGNVDADGDENMTDTMAGLFNPIPGEYILNISVTNQTGSSDPFSLDIGAWDSDQYSRVTPYGEIPVHLIPRPVPFRIDEQNSSRSITIPCRGQAPLNVSFIDLALLENCNNTWYFGDGTMSSDLMTASHEYRVPGLYTVRLVTWNNSTVSTISIPVVVEKSPVPLVADFQTDYVTGTPPLTVNFTDLSTGDPVSWNWTFGDGTTSHEQNPVHTYNGIGRYTATLEIANIAGNQSMIRKPQSIMTNSGRIVGPNGMIWISSSPSDALVYVDRAFAGVTPLRSSGIPAGVQQIRVSKDGYRDWVGYVQISQGGYTYVPKVILRKD